MSRRYTSSSRGTVGYIGAFPPSPLPTAMFTMDLANATDLIGWQSRVIEIDPFAAIDRWRDSKILVSITPDDPAGFAVAAAGVATAGLDLLCLQFAPDLFSRVGFSNLSTLCRLVSCPIVAVVHAVEPEPSASAEHSIHALIPRVDKFVAMAQGGLGMLESVYGVPKHKLAYIPHGAPSIDREPGVASEAKRRLGFSSRTTITSFGCLDPGKGIEDVLQAIAQIAGAHPEILYVIVGRAGSRPDKPADNSYRDALDLVVDRLHLGAHVRWVDRYLDLPSLIEHLMATDVFIHPNHDNADQIASEALAYALAAGLLVVSTPTTIARELLANRRGYLYPFRDVDALARRLESILHDVEESELVREHACTYGRGMTWEDVGLKYVQLFESLLGDRNPVQDDRLFNPPSSSEYDVSSR